jgi:adenylate cyclase
MSDSKKRRLSAILFTDMVGYTDLMSRDEKLANRLRKRQSQVLNEMHAKYQGEILQYFGDGTLSIFESAVKAVQCAIDIQLNLKKEPKVPLRIGIHSGEVVWDDEGIYGHAVNIASRLESMAAPGSILVSDKIREEASNRPDLNFKSLGLFELKNVPFPMELLTVDHPDFMADGSFSVDGKGKKLDPTASTKSSGDQNPIISIAVLPFDDLSPGKDQEYFCDGMSDEIITDLSGLQQMRVIARHSSSQLKNSTLSVEEIGKKLGVELLLTGSVRKAGENLRITAQLIKVSENHQIWAEKFQGTMEDIFDLQSSISKQIITSLDLQLNSKEEKRLDNRPIEDPRAYDAYLRARREIFQMTVQSMEKAEHLIGQAMELIGPNPLLIATKGQVHMSYIMLGIKPDPIHLKIAEECLDELKLLDHGSPYIHLLSGLLRYKQARIQEAANDLKKVLEQNPSNRDGLLYLGIVYILAGQSEKAEPLLEELVEVDPLTAVNYIMPGYAKACQGDLKSAAAHYWKAYKMEPENPMLILMMGIVPGRVEPPETIIPILNKLEPMVHYHIFGRVARFLRLALSGDKEEALKAGENSQLQNEARWDEHAAWWMAGTYAFLNEKDKALYWLEISINLGNFNYPFLYKHDPFLENLRNEPKFKALMADVKKKWAAFKS